MKRKNEKTFSPAKRRLNRPTPGDKIENKAAVAWTSLPGDVTTPQSTYNALSTERYYDPHSNVNVYGTSATVVLQAELPKTGFAPGRITPIPPQRAAYQNLGQLVLEIPKLGVKVPIVGVPRTNEGWDLTWLWDQAGWLEGTAFPTWTGNTAITAHVYLPSGAPGPFHDLGNLRWGDRILIHAYGQTHVYEVRNIQTVKPWDMRPLAHKDRDWLTLITCVDYDPKADTYRGRLIVQAVLVGVYPER